MPAASKSTPQAASLLARAAQSRAAGRPAEAIAALREAALHHPANADIHYELALAYLDTGHAAEGLAALQRATTLNPAHAKALLRLGITHDLQGNQPAALTAYQAAVQAQPSLTEAQYRLGNLLEFRGETKAAAAAFRRGAASVAKTTLPRLCAARLALLEQRDQDAERLLRQIVTREPQNPVANNLLAGVLANAGKFDEARACYDTAISRSPMLAGNFYDLVRCRKITPADAPLIPRIEAALADPRLDPGKRARIHLARGKVADDLGDYELAMHHWSEAATLRDQITNFDAAAFNLHVDRLIAHFSAERLANPSQNADRTPIFILGMPRSGTTLVEQILSSHPEVAAGGELPFWNERRLQWDEAIAATTETTFIAQAAAGYLQTLRAIAPRAPRVTDKMPFNFLWAGLIHLAFPHAIILHCRRAAIDTALSIHQTHFSPRIAFPTGGANLVAYYEAYTHITDHWQQTLPPDRFISVDYEPLTAEPERHIRRIVAACGLAWNDACLRPQDNVRMVNTPSKWQVRQPIYRTAADRWRRYEPWLGPLRALVAVKEELLF